jgi:exopolysaccharide production protein ExoQ
MPPNLALCLTIAFAVFLFRRDFRETRNVTAALWIPLVWLLLIGSRPLSNWLSIFGVPMGPSSTEEGTPIDAFVYLILIALAVYVLNRRQINLAEVFRDNGWLIAFLLYCFVAIFWSDIAFTAFKRWIKVIGHPVMILVVFTEPDPAEALKRLIQRAAYILLPFSILVIKYFDSIGRHYDEFTGLASNRGLNYNKNGLGAVCMVMGYFFFWQLLQVWRLKRGKSRRDKLILLGGLLLMVGYLLRKAHSMTPTLSLLIGITVMLAVGLRFVQKRTIGVYIALAAITLIVAELSFGIYEWVVELTGHESTIEGRENLWGELLAFHTNPLFGVGYESFWSGDRLQQLWQAHAWHPTEAHNGYLETYLNLGWVGLLMLGGLFLATYRKIRFELLTNFEWGRFRLGFLVAIIAHNWTEATFKGLSIMWFVFYMIALDYGRIDFEPQEEARAADGSEEEKDLAYVAE